MIQSVESRLHGYCILCSFSGEVEDGDTRFLITSAQHVGPSSVLEFELVMVCLHPAPQHHRGEPPVRLEYSTDHGMSWDLVLEGCHPPATCSHYHSASVYQAAEFTRWKRVTIVLPLATWYKWSDL